MTHIDVFDPPMWSARGHRWLEDVCERYASRVAWVPWYPEVPVGPRNLLQLARGTTDQSATFALAGDR